jgi:uncharacterized protein with GYD domain
MPKYLLKVSYTLQGIQGVRKEGGSGRREAAAKLCESAGGKLESLYFAFGTTDVYAVADLPDNVAAANVATAVAASGSAAVETVALLTTDEIDKAVKGAVEYRAPGA